MRVILHTEVTDMILGCCGCVAKVVWVFLARFWLLEWQFHGKYKKHELHD